MSWRIKRMASDLAGALASPVIRSTRPTPPHAIVLAYHRIGLPGDSLLDHALWNASADQFRDQIRWLGSRADIVPLLELPDLLTRGGRGRYVSITFDDGYRDNSDTAFPILREMAAPATFFVSTGFVDSHRTPWWDEIAWMVRTTTVTTLVLPGTHIEVPVAGSAARAISTILKHVKTIPGQTMEQFIAELGEVADTDRIPAKLAPQWMSWADLRELESSGMAIGGHTVNHPVLARLPAEDQRREMVNSLDRLNSELRHTPRAMSYPVGGSQAYSRETRELAESTGWAMACNYRGGYLRGPITDRFDVPRIQMEPYTRLNDLAAILAWPRVFAQ